MLKNAICTGDNRGEELNRADRLQDCMISSAMKNITSHDSLLGITPNKSRVRAFGCTAYMHMDKEVRTLKLSDQAQLEVYLAVRIGSIERT